MRRRPKNQVKKITPFYSEKEALFYNQMSREFTLQNAHNTIKLYRVDSVKSKVKNLYGEAKPQNKKILPPVELNVIINIGELNYEYRSEVGAFDQKFDEFNFGVYIDDLDKADITITRGDYVKYYDGQVDRTYEITTVSEINSKNSLMGDKPLYKLVQASQVREDVVLID